MFPANVYELLTTSSLDSVLAEAAKSYPPPAYENEPACGGESKTIPVREIETIRSPAIAAYAANIRSWYEAA